MLELWPPVNQAAIDSYLATALAAVESGVQVLTASELRGVRAKGPKDIVTAVDLAVERAVSAFLDAATPEVTFIGEESGPHQRGTLAWVLDPIDGTVNFSRGLPTFAISLALLDESGAAVAVTSAPQLGETYSAMRGRGAEVNGQSIHARSTKSLKDAIICLDDFAPGDKFAHERARIYSVLAPRVFRMRTTGCAALDLAWLAAGRVDGVLMLSNQPWDTAAGVCLAVEAGASITDLAGRKHAPESGSLLAASGVVGSQILDLLRSADLHLTPQGASG